MEQSFAARTGLKPGTNEYKLAWARANSERAKAAKRRYREANGEKLRKDNARYRRENPEKRAATVRSWAARHPEKVREMRRAGMERARRRDPAKFILREHTRRFGKGTATREEWQAIYDRHNGRCAYCDDAATTIDHVVPLSRGGRHEATNLVPACKPCNSSKQNKLLSEWKGRLCQKSA